MAHTGDSFMLGIHLCQSLCPVYSFDHSANANAFAVSHYPPASMAENASVLLGSSHGFSFDFVLGFPLDAFPPIAAIRLRSLAPSFLLRASPAFRAIRERSSGLSFLFLASPPSRPRACACGFSFLAFTKIR
jgi:hypothetical protein